MLTYSPSGALSPYHYKGGYFHGIHYGSYFEDSAALFAIMDQEEVFILQSCQRRRVMIDLYETTLTTEVLAALVAHIGRLAPHIYKLGISASRRSLRQIKKALHKAQVLGKGQVFFSEDMEEAKTWLVR